MNLRDALLAPHDADRMPAEVDRRLRRRLGLETPRRAWLRPTVFAGFAIATAAAAAVIAVVVTRGGDETPPTPVATVAPVTPAPTPSAPSTAPTPAGLVDVSPAPWTGTVTADALDVRADSPTSATVTWRETSIVAAPGTRVRAGASSLVLAEGAIELEHSKPASSLLVEVPAGRVVIAAYRSSIKADRETVTIELADGSGQYTDAAGQAHALAPGAPFVWPSQQPTPAPAPTPTTKRVPRTPAVESSAQASPHDAPPTELAPPSLTPSRAGVACTFKSDCEPGQTCRKDERGQSVCMGHGAPGAACWFDSDCQSQSCVERRCAAN